MGKIHWKFQGKEGVHYRVMGPKTPLQGLDFQIIRQEGKKRREKRQKTPLKPRKEDDIGRKKWRDAIGKNFDATGARGEGRASF